ncbi:hypothetical protein D9M72_532460 [compost metagenome]
MIEAGLVTKTTRQSDRRSVVLSLTDEGISTFKKVLPIVIKNNERCFADFSEEEIQSFMHTLRRIILNIKTESAASGPDDVVVDYELSNSIFPAKAFPRRSSSKGR